MSNTQYYDDTHIKSVNKCGCAICGRGTNRLDVLSELHLCSPECEGVFYGMIAAQEIINAM